MSKYWDIGRVLPYQRRFNFINGPRSIGKTYTTQKFLIKKALNENKQFVYIVRTKQEIQSGAFEQAFEKVCDREYKDIEFKWENDTLLYKDACGCYIVLGYCLALSNYAKLKMRSFPQVYYWLMDEYMLEDNSTARYINGWREPDIALSLYHTIDREEDRVTCFFLGNNTTFYNPYHLHPAFHIPQIKPGGIWTSENVLFQWVQPSEELSESKKKSKFLRMIDGTDYSRYSIGGEYIEDNESFIEDKPGNTHFVFSVVYGGQTYGVWRDNNRLLTFIDQKVDPYGRVCYALDMNEHSSHTVLSKRDPYLNWLVKDFKNGNVRFVNGEVKKKAEMFIASII